MNIRFSSSTTLALTVTFVLMGSTSFLAADDDDDRNSQFDFALIGDVPYAPTAGTGNATYQTYPSTEYNALIVDINNHNRVAFTAHIGDIKAGNTWCAGGTPTPAPLTAPTPPAGAVDVYTTNLGFFNTFRNGLVYMVGDNEWTDCHRANNGGYSPVERLAYVRSTVSSQ